MNDTIFWKKKIIEHEIRVLISSTNLSEIFLTLRIIQRAIIINVLKSSCKVPDIPVRF
jgi:hypothetical protein